MIRKQSMLVLGAAILFGLIAVYLVNIYIGGVERRDEARDPNMPRVAVARVPLEFGARLTPANVQFIEWPSGNVPQGALNRVEDLSPAGNPQVVLRPIAAGEPILRSKLSGEGGRATLSALLPPDKMAVAIRITDVAGVAGFALPGDHVDVLLTRDVADRPTTDVVLQNVRLIAIDQDANENSEQPTLGRTATLEVTREDAQKLALGQAVGTMSLALRSAQSDQNLTYASTVHADHLRSGSYYRPAVASAAPRARIMRRRAPRPEARPVVPVTSTVEVVRGTTGQNYEVIPYRGS